MTRLDPSGVQSEYLQAVEKAELHVHLEGSVEPETLVEMHPSLTSEEILERYRCSDFAGFLEAYKWVTRKLERPEHFAMAARHLLNRLHSQKVSYVEITLSAGVLLSRRLDPGPILHALEEESAAQPAIEVHWILDAVRHFGVEPAMRVAELTAAHAGPGVIAFGLGGDEARDPAEGFHEVFRFAQQAGLRLVAHAGETTGPATIWRMLENGAERIGHGIRAIDDRALVRHLADHGIPLEICVSSNVITGAVASLTDHPVRRLYDSGVPIVLNTDDPAIFRTDLNREFAMVAAEFHFSEREMREIAANGFRYAFRPASATMDLHGV
jgi:adenosine deaminase/aminodeoxyfutalosine deaminase